MCLRNIENGITNRLPLVSVIVITKNNAETIEKCIVGLLNQDYPKERYEIIFVDGHSTDGTDKIIKKYARIYSFINLYYEDRGTMGYARNLGISKSKGSIIAFIDGDAFPPENWIKKIIATFKSDNKLVAVGGLDILTSSNKTASLIDSWRRLKRTLGIKAIPCMKTVNLALKRNVVLACKGFDPGLSHSDEEELLARIHLKMKTDGILYDPEIIVYHERLPSTDINKSILKTFRKSVIGTSTLMRRHMMKVAIMNPMSPVGTSFFLVLACIASIPLLVFSIITGSILNTLTILLLLYLAMMGAHLIKIFLSTRKFTLGIPLFLTLYFAVRFVGTFFGLAKWLANNIMQNCKIKIRG